MAISGPVQNLKLFISFFRSSVIIQWELHFVNSYTRNVLSVAPTLARVAENAAQHPKVAEYLEADGHMPYSGLNLLW